MTLAEFKVWALAQGSVAKYNDGQYKGECVSLINQYCYRVLTIPADAWGHAKDWAVNASPLAYFDKVGGSPKAGDVIVYGANYGGGFGHIEISLGNNQVLFQNRNGNRLVGMGMQLPGAIAILRPKKIVGGSMLKQIYIPNKTDVDKAFKELYGRPANVANIAEYTKKDISWMWHDFAYSLKKLLDQEKTKAASLQRQADVDTNAKKISQIKEIVK